MAAANVIIHSSQFPASVQRDLLESLRTRRVNHKFLYDSFQQTQKWLALHEAHSPARTDNDCLEIYDRAFVETAAKISAPSVHVLGLGCGGGQKDTRLLELLRLKGRELSYTPCDVSVAMTLVARETASAVVPTQNCYPLVCDLATADDLVETIANLGPSSAARITTFFGMIPNFEPDVILPRLAALVRPGDCLLFSANLAPGTDYTAGMEKIRPQYDNALTRDWLLAFLDETGLKREAGELHFTIEEGAMGLKRVQASFRFTRAAQVKVNGEELSFALGETLRLFFSYRYTPNRVEKLLANHGLQIQAQWFTQSEEEGVFLCRRA